MASVIYNEFKRANAAAEIDLNADDIRAKLLMNNTSCDTENDGIVTLNQFTNMDICDATNYADQALGGEAVNKDDANDRAEFDANNISFTMDGDASRDYQGVLLYKYVSGATTADLAIAFIEFSNQPLSSGATQVDVPWNSEGILQLT